MSKRFSRWSLGLAALGFALASVGGVNAQDLTIGSKAPAIDIEHWVSNGNGKFKPVKQFEAGKVYVVEFWATWCGPCVMSMPHLADTQNKFADKGVQLISVSDEDLETVEAFLKRPVKGADKDDKEKTYGKLTSAYCLTTDPDKSVYQDYMEAASQNGIPTCFIVGKTGLIEWIGHPMEMDSPLEKVVDGSWDRNVYLAAFKKEQQFNVLMTKLSRPMQKGDTKTALKILEKARAEAAGDETIIAVVDDLEVRVNLVSVMQKLEAGEADEALAELDVIAKSAKPSQKLFLGIARCKALITIVSESGKRADEAAKAVAEVAANKEADPLSLNELAWAIYEAAEDDQKFPKALIVSGTAAAEAAVAQSDNGAILDTLAHLLYIQGNIDRAIELQTKALAKAPAESKQEMQEFLDEMKEKKAKK